MKQDRVSEKNILFIAYEFPPRGESGVQRSAKFAKYLPYFGYNPLVLAGAVEEIESKTDSSLMKDVQDTTVFRCRGSERFLVRFPDRIEPLRRLLKFCVLPDMNMVAWLPYAERMALKIAKQHPIQAIYTSVPYFSSGLLGRRIKKILGIPWVVDFRDPWSDDAIRFWSSKLHYRIQESQERRVVKTADAVVVVTPTMKDLMVTRYPQWADKIHVISNGFDPEDFPDGGGTSPSSKLRIGYAGKMIDYDRWTVRGSRGPFSRFWMSRVAFRHSVVDFSTHSPYYLLHAVRALLDAHPEFEDKITLSFAGIFGDNNRKIVRDLGLENVVSIKGYLPHVESVRLLLDSDVLFLPMMMSADGRRSYIYSGKIFEYLGARRPILAAVPDGDARDLIRTARAGWWVEPRDVEAIKKLLADLIEKKSRGLLNLDPDEQFIRQFERRNLTQRLARLFDSLLC